MKPEANPLVSVVVLTYKRRADLTRTLQTIAAQTYARCEVVVVDNNSGDGTPEFLAESFPEVRVVALKENLGCGGRNRGVEAARGDLVVTLDNDVCFDSANELSVIVESFAARPEVAVLIFKVLDAQRGRLLLRDWCHPRDARVWADKEFETCFIAEGACAFRRDAFLQVGGYFEPFYIGCEGWDLALRMIDSGMQIVYCPHIAVRHWMGSETRSGRRPYYYYTRNNIWIAFKNYSGLRKWNFLSYSLAMMAFYCLRWPRGTAEVVRGMRDGFRTASGLSATRVSRRAWRQVDEIRAHRPQLWTRVLAHLGDAEV